VTLELPSRALTTQDAIYDCTYTVFCFLVVLLSSNLNLSATDPEDWTNDYPIAPKYKDLFDDITPRWRATPLPAYDTDGKFIDIRNHKVSLSGSLVLVYFQLRHYVIRNKRTNGVGGNTFSAVATQVKILQHAAERGSSPYKSLLLKGPTLLPQSPSVNKDQTAAVRAFHPGMILIGSNSAETILIHH